MAAHIETVLLVDDDEDVRAILELCLGPVWPLLIAGNGRDALLIAERERPSIALVDLCMPGMDGLALLRALRRREATASLPVIFLTAAIQPDEVAHYRALGALGVIPKPFRPFELPTLMRRMIQEVLA